MFGGNAIGLANHLISAVAYDDFAIVVPGLPRDVARRQDRQQSLNLSNGFASKFLGVGEQYRRGARSMLGLTKQIGGTDFAIDAVVRNDQRFRWSGEQINANPAEQLPFGFRYIRIARTDDHVD